MMRLTHQRTLVESLLTRRHIQRGVLVEEIHRLQTDLEDLTGHDGEVLDAGDMVDAELDPDDDVLVFDIVLARGPGAHARAAAGLVGVPAAGVEFAVGVGGDVDVVVGELGALEVEAAGVGEHFLEGRGVDLVGDGFAVDGVADVGVLDLEGAVGVRVEVDAGGRVDDRFVDDVAVAVRVPVVANRHGVGFVVDEAVGVAVEHGVDAEGEDVLVVDGQDARVHDGAEGDTDFVELVIERRGGEDAGGADFVRDFAGLVEHEGQDVLVVADGDDGLEHEFAVAGYSGAAGAVVRVFPADAAVLFVDADAVLDGRRDTLVVGDHGGEVLDVAETVAAQLEVVCHCAGAGIAKIEGGLLVEW